MLRDTRPLNGKMRAQAASLLLALASALLTVQAEQPHVCMVIRSYYAHGTYGDSSLINLLHSLKKQEHSRWAARSSTAVTVIIHHEMYAGCV